MGFLNRGGGFNPAGNMGRLGTPTIGGQGGPGGLSGQWMQDWQQRMSTNPSPWFQQMQQNRPEMTNRLMTWQPGQLGRGGPMTPPVPPAAGTIPTGPMETGALNPSMLPDLQQLLAMKRSGAQPQMPFGSSGGNAQDFWSFLQTRGQVR